ncbi:MAG: DUF4360 domain-containing protein [Bacteriovoracaceae bacterium]|nr:DUF4360 domain-containing protein [Bacteriovoracaceae bacterium]
MKLKMKKLLSALLTVGFYASMTATQSLAQPTDPIRMGNVIVNGTGCPDSSSVSALVSPDQTSLSILFNNYVVDAGAQAPGRAKLGRKNCNIRIQLFVPQGYAVSIFKVDYRGFVDLPYGASAEFSSEYFFGTSQGIKKTQVFTGKQSQDFKITNQIGVESVVWSDCGASTNLAMGTTLKVKVQNNRDEAQATLDSIDVSSAIQYQLQWRRCSF